MQQWQDSFKLQEKEFEACGQIDKMNLERIPEIRSCQAKVWYSTQAYKEIRNHYKVAISTQTIGGVLTEIFTPESGLAPQNTQRVLMNLHGGAFRFGSRAISQFESIPIASVAKIKVISVDYRMAPEYSFPAASEDVEAVYRELIKTYDPKNIGIFGCSAGGLLTAQSIAWLQTKNLPTPGAIGMFCAGASYFSDGDSGHFATMWEKRPANLREDPAFEYLLNVDSNDTLAYPVRSEEVMARFPPSLLISSTRDLALSSVVHTHMVLVQQGVPAELYVWEGLPHGFFVDALLPQSREMFDITARFFDQYLGKAGAEAGRPGSGSGADCNTHRRHSPVQGEGC